MALSEKMVPIKIHWVLNLFDGFPYDFPFKLPQLAPFLDRAPASPPCGDSGDEGRPRSNRL